MLVLFLGHLQEQLWWYIFLSGVKNADENELRSIASDPDEIHMYNVNDFQFLLDIVDDLTINLCNSVKGPGRKTVTCSFIIQLVSLVLESTYRYIDTGFFQSLYPDSQTSQLLSFVITSV